MGLIQQGLSLFLGGLAFCASWSSWQLSLAAQPIIDQLNHPFATSTPTAIAQLPTISIAQLPPEAKNTLNLIGRGGPFPYRQDGTIFSNREGKLPKKPKGYYREYTVPTPGASNRGARRFVTGQNREIYYTNDHYRSFFRVTR